MPRRLRRTLKLVWLCLGVAIAAVVAVALAIQFRIHLANDWQQYAKLPRMASPTKTSSVLVFAPHSDDETLGCGGMIAQAKRNGAAVQVVLITNGDGFRIGVARVFKTVRVTPEMCVKYAYRRQRETLSALHVLGLPARDVTFLGYPDRGIAALWDTYWAKDDLYTSRATRSDRSPYADSFTYRAPYCGESLLADIERVIVAQKPTDVYLPHPSDNHSDHFATYCFVAAAIEQLRADGNAFARKIRMHTYLVHRGDWPTPKGYDPDDPLAPPHGLAKGDTKWRALELEPGVDDLKRKAIGCYNTQEAMEKGFLMSFARSNELFGDLPVRRIPHVADGTVTIDGNPEDWRAVPPAVVDPVGDYVMAGMSKGGDVRAIYLCSDDRFIYVRVDCARKMSKRITYTLNFRGLSKGDTNDRHSVSVRPPKRISPEGIRWAYKGDHMEIALPRKDFRIDNDLFVQVYTKLMKITVDNTGWHSVQF